MSYFFVSEDPSLMVVIFKYEYSFFCNWVENGKYQATQFEIFPEGPRGAGRNFSSEDLLNVHF